MLRIPSVMIITGLRLGEHMRTQQDRSEGRERENDHLLRRKVVEL